MQRHFDFSSYADKVRAVVVEELESARSEAAICGTTSRITSLAEETLAENIGFHGPEHIACRAGCGTCCVLNVSTLLPEAIAIAAYVQREFSEEEFTRLKERIDQLYADSRWLDEEERLFLRRPCAFLDEAKSCAIYPVRPLLCRSMTSTDSDSCLQAIAMPALGEFKPVLMNLFQKSLMNATFETLGQVLDEMGLDSRGVRLTEAVKALLEEPELAEEFGAGKRIAL
jgi:Fe-S-cluster containining protein